MPWYLVVNYLSFLLVPRAACVYVLMALMATRPPFSEYKATFMAYMDQQLSPETPPVLEIIFS